MLFNLQVESAFLQMFPSLHPSLNYFRFCLQGHQKPRLWLIFLSIPTSLLLLGYSSIHMEHLQKLCRVYSQGVSSPRFCLPLAVHSLSGIMGLIRRNCAHLHHFSLTAPPLVLHIHLATSFQQLVDLHCFLTVSYLLLSGLNFAPCPPGPLLSFLLPLAPLHILNSSS